MTVNKTFDILNLLRSEYKLRVQLSGGVSAKLIGPIHQIFLTIDKVEEKFHLGDLEFENLMIYLARDELRIDFKPSDMNDLKMQLKKMVTEIPESAAKK